MKDIGLFVLFILMLLSQGCVNSQSRVVSELQETKDVFIQEYKIDIHRHFPEKIKDADFINTYLIRPDSFSYFGSSLVTVRASKEEISGILKKYPNCKSIRGNEFFIVDCGLFRDCDNYDSLRSYDESVPIPDFRKIDFKLGEIPDSVFIPKIGKKAPIYNFVIPEDMTVVVIKSHSGNFWKSNHNERRCAKISPWQNGYSYGYAISEKYDYITYWAIAW